MILTVLALAWVTISLPVALLIGAAIRRADRRG